MMYGNVPESDITIQPSVTIKNPSRFLMFGFSEDLVTAQIRIPTPKVADAEKAIGIISFRLK